MEAELVYLKLVEMKVFGKMLKEKRWFQLTFTTELIFITLFSLCCRYENTPRKRVLPLWKYYR